MQGFNLEIHDEALKDQAILLIQEFYRQNKWIEGVASGENAIFFLNSHQNDYIQCIQKVERKV
jgi:hypothetical protein